MVDTKACTKCLQVLPADAFTKASTPTGLKARCRECENARVRAHYAANREAKLAKNKAWREANPERMKQLVRTWQQEHVEEERARRQKWREENYERYRANANAWSKANPEIGRKKSQKRRAIERNAFVEDIDPRVVAQRDGNTCQLCKKEVDMQLKYPDPGFGSLDHIKPLAKGGSHAYANVQLAHLVCNLMKSDKLVEVF